METVSDTLQLCSGAAVLRLARQAGAVAVTRHSVSVSPVPKAKSGSVGAFLEALKASEATLGAQCPPLDKKREKGLVKRARAAFRRACCARGKVSMS